MDTSDRTEMFALIEVPIRNDVDRVVYKVCGGIKGTSRVTGRSRDKVRDWLKAGYIDNRDDAVALAAEAQKKGMPITAAALLAINDEHVPTPSEPTTADRRRARARARSAPSLSRPAVAPAAFSHASAPGGRRRVVLGGSQAANG